MGKYIGF